MRSRHPVCAGALHILRVGRRLPSRRMKAHGGSRAVRGDTGSWRSPAQVLIPAGVFGRASWRKGQLSRDLMISVKAEV